jgi:ATP-dependent helicase/nuclease subunit A
MSLTSAQKQAVAARGNVLVVAGAGTGKTSTLVERCLHCLLEETPPVSIEEILMVTFTDAAATEMREKIREALNHKILELERPHDSVNRAATPEPALKDRRSAGWLTEQLALFETAHIGTLHSFCLKLLRQHFYELELDPQLAVMAEEEARLLADETLDGILQEHYAGETESAEAVRQLIQTHGRGWDQPVRALVLRLHHYTQTLRDPEAWFASQLAMFQSPSPGQWRNWLEAGLRDWRDEWLASLEAEDAENKIAAQCAALLRELPDKPVREQTAAMLARVRIVEQDCPHGKKAAWCKPIEGLFEEARFLESVAEVRDGKDPLAEDWGWVRGQMTALLDLAREFTISFGTAKRELGMVDFHDLEQHALRLLWDRATGQPTEIARRWREQLRFVFVDEYQDINEAQDAILKALSRDGAAANRFLVGDVKQSIYGFRLADPRIFQDYVEKWRDDQGITIPLVDNFRSREAIIEFVNSVFGVLMRRETGGVPYDEEARLRFGDAEHRAALSRRRDPAARVELCLRLRGGDPAGETARAGIEVMNLEEAGKEARLVAMRLRELKSSGHQVWDGSKRAMRPVEWGDMAVLLRSPAGKAESFAREFARAGVPLVVARSGFYDSAEVADLLSLLQLFDNPLQDLPALAVLRSPLVGMSLDELAVMRLAQPEGHVWTALQRYHDATVDDSGRPKADRFLKNFGAWRRLARQVSLSRCLEAVLDGTHYADWLLTQPRGEQRHANVRRLLALAQQFDRFQRQGLFRFLRFVEAQRAAETGPEVAAVSGENSVFLMSIHQSKGLEFPVVAVVDLGKPFNLSDLRAEIILDEEYGLCPQIKPPHSGQRYPSLPWWLARRRQKRKSLGEELRLLYVAMTRARDTLILSGTASAKKFAGAWQEGAELDVAKLLAAGSYLDWIAGWAAAAGVYPNPPAGESALWRWTIYDDLDERLADAAAQASTGARTDALIADPDDAAWRKLRQRLAWQYPHAAATRLPAKTTVTALRRQFADEIDAQQLFGSEVQSPKPKVRGRSGGKPAGLTAAEIGTAHHAFLQLVALERAGRAEDLRQEAQRLQATGALSADEIACLDFDALGAFWESDLGRRIRAQAENVRRELEFTTRFPPGELEESLVASAKAAGRPMVVAGGEDRADGEFVVVQGAADLAVLLPGEIWLVDFKTDQITASELAGRVKLYEVQLRLYAQALSRIYGRPVTEAWLHFLALRKSVRVELTIQS